MLKIINFAFASLLLIIIIPVALADYTEPTFPNPIPPNCPTGSPGCDPAIDVSSVGQIKTGGLSIQGLFRALTKLLIGGTPGETPNANLTLDVEGRVGATEYCDEKGNFCTAAEEVNEGNKMIGGTNITITPASGLGDVTIDGANIIAGSYITLDPPTGKYGDVTINAERGDNWDHIATKNIQLGGFYLSNAGADAGLLINTTGDGVFKQKLYVTGASEFTGNGLFKNVLDVTGLGKFATGLEINGGNLKFLGNSIQLLTGRINKSGSSVNGLKFSDTDKGEFGNGLKVSGDTIDLQGNTTIGEVSSGRKNLTVHGDVAINGNTAIGTTLEPKSLNVNGDTTIVANVIRLLGNTTVGATGNVKDLTLTNNLLMPAVGKIFLGTGPGGKPTLSKSLTSGKELYLEDDDGVVLQSAGSVAKPILLSAKDINLRGDTAIGTTAFPKNLTVNGDIITDGKIILGDNGSPTIYSTGEDLGIGSTETGGKITMLGGTGGVYIGNSGSQPSITIGSTDTTILGYTKINGKLDLFGGDVTIQASSPPRKFIVDADTTITGDLKISKNAGYGQVLISSDNSGNAVWGDQPRMLTVRGNCTSGSTGWLGSPGICSIGNHASCVPNLDPSSSCQEMWPLNSPALNANDAYSRRYELNGQGYAGGKEWYVIIPNGATCRFTCTQLGYDSSL